MKTLTLERVTPANFDKALALKTKRSQADFCPDNAYSLVQASLYPSAKTWRRLICADGVPVGFVMIWAGDVKIDGTIFLWRFLIGGKHQGKGLGADAFKLVLDRARRNWPKAHTMKSCFIRGDGGPERFWLGQGFTITENADAPVGHEVGMEMPLRSR